MENQPTRSPSRHRHRGVWLSAVIVGCLTVVSFVATFSGWRAVIGGTPDVPWGGALLAGLVTAGIQAGLLLAVIKTKSAPRLRDRLYWVAIYVIVMLISVTFGVGFWTHRLQGYDMSAQDHHVQLARVTTPLLAFSRAYEAISDTSQELAVHSAAMYQKETQTGDSCGYATLSWEGPRARLRERDQAMFQGDAAFAAARHEEVQEVIDNLPATFDAGQIAAQEQALRQAVLQMVGHRADPRLAQMRKRVATRMLQDEFADNGGSFRCADARLVTLAGDLLAAVDALPGLPESATLHITPYDQKAAIGIVFGTLQGKVTDAIDVILPQTRNVRRVRRTTASRDAASEASTHRLLPLAIALGVVIDTLIFLLCVPPGSSTGKPGPLGDRLGEGLEALEPDPRLRARVSQFLCGVEQPEALEQALRRRFQVQRGVPCILIADGHLAEPGTMALERLMDLLDHLGAATISHDGPRPASIAQTLGRLLGRTETSQPSRVHIWRLRATGAAALRLTARLICTPTPEPEASTA